MIPAQPAMPEVGGRQMVVVPFSIILDGFELRLGTNVHKVLEVVETNNLDPLPSNYAPFSHLYVRCGVPIPVMILSTALRELGVAMTHGRPWSSTRAITKRLIICHLHHYSIGMVVDWTERICVYDQADIMPPPPAVHGRGGEIFSGIIHDAFDPSGVRYLLGIEAILAAHKVPMIKNENAGSSRRTLAGKRVLVVEDSKLFQDIICRMLTRNGAICSTAENGKEGLKAIEAGKFDLIVSDIEMPIMDGLTMVRSLPKNFRTPILFNSSIADPTFIETTRREGLGNSYFVKMDEHAILSKIDEIMRAA